MLQSIHVKNLALIEETEVEFTEGFNIITGETGAGKSLLIGSVNLALGGKFDASLLRKGADSGLVELVFNSRDGGAVRKMQEMDLETEPQSEGPPYGLTLHGLTADIITSYNGEFDDTWFLQQLGDALRIDMESSAYHNVTDVTFSKEDYAGDKDADKVYHYIYFNDDPDWKLLSTYYMKDNAYVFTLVAHEQPESETNTLMPGEAAGTGTAGSAGTGSGTVTYSAPTSGTSGGSNSEPVETSFDILSVSTNLVAFCGGKEDFYQACFDYVIESGKTGVIVGTMSGFEIDPEEKKADFKISLNIGGAITGTYDKGKNKFSFSGL
jgi:hypothetical protein